MLNGARNNNNTHSSNTTDDDDDDPYESLPGGRNTGVYMLAGAAAGTLEHCIAYPIDVIRTRMQSLVVHHPKLVHQPLPNLNSTRPHQPPHAAHTQQPQQSATNSATTTTTTKAAPKLSSPLTAAGGGCSSGGGGGGVGGFGGGGGFATATANAARTASKTASAQHFTTITTANTAPPTTTTAATAKLRASAASSMFRTNFVKFKVMYRGMSAVVVGAGPAHALYFAAYENSKLLLTAPSSSSSSTVSSLPQSSSSSPASSSSTTSLNRIFVHGISGCCATLVHDAVMNPFDVVKQRMQVCNSPFARPVACAKHILKHEGPKAFYRSYLTQLTMNLPYQALHFITYEAAQDYLNRARDYNPVAHIASGAVAGATAAACTTPLDVCKTLLNTQEKQALKAANCERVIGLFNAATIVYRCRGFGGFFLGMPARILYATPSTAASWFVYEFFKNYCGAGSNSD